MRSTLSKHEADPVPTIIVVSDVSTGSALAIFEQSGAGELSRTLQPRV